MKKKELSIVIPILNEEKNIITLFNLIKKSLTNINYEVIFVDDNSSDSSIQILINLKKKNKNIDYILRKKKRDLTKSCFDGFEKARYKQILVMDGDLQHNPRYIKNMLNTFIKNDLDIIVGARDFKKIVKGLSFIRKLASIFLTILISVILTKKTKDPMSGFFILKKAIYKTNKKNFFGNGYKILCDLIYNCKEQIKIQDYFIKFRKRNEGKSKMNLNILLKIILLIFFSFKIKKFFI
jgi:dolichol-phosphate mannosyltransferase